MTAAIRLAASDCFGRKRSGDRFGIGRNFLRRCEDVEIVSALNTADDLFWRVRFLDSITKTATGAFRLHARFFNLKRHALLRPCYHTARGIPMQVKENDVSLLLRQTRKKNRSAVNELDVFRWPKSAGSTGVDESFGHRPQGTLLEPSSFHQGVNDCRRSSSLVTRVVSPRNCANSSARRATSIA